MSSQYAKSHYNTRVNALATHPLSYCMGDSLDQQFTHGGHSSALGKNSRECQRFMPEYCSGKWDAFCEAASRDTSGSFFPDTDMGTRKTARAPCGSRNVNLTYGQKLVYTTAQRKYLVEMRGVHARKLYEPFDPTVANSPLISYWTGPRVPSYAITDPSTIDADPVMNKLLDTPEIGPDILLNIYNTMARKGTLHTLRGTRLARFFVENARAFKDASAVLT